jgi:hypothetical protein
MARPIQFGVSVPGITRLLAIVAALLIATGTSAVILLRSGDPTANTTEPTGELAGSGWQFEGMFGSFLGTAIGPHHFITAKHIGQVSDTFVFHGSNFPVVKAFADSKSDLQIFEIRGELEQFASLYSRSDEVGKRLVVIGRGTQRGATKIMNGELRGWEYGDSDRVQRWGENEVTSVTARFLFVLFDQPGLPQEAHVSSGDSGGGVFLKEGAVWKLAGINSDVDTFVSGPDRGGPFSAALFDQRGSYRSNGTLVAGDKPVPSGFYAARISQRVDWIQSVLGGKETPAH